MHFIKNYTVIRFVSTSAKFGTCTVVRVNGTLVEDKIRTFKGECAHLGFNKCPIYTRDGESAKFSTNSHVTDNSVQYMLQNYSFLGCTIAQALLCVNQEDYS